MNGKILFAVAGLVLLSGSTGSVLAGVSSGVQTSATNAANETLELSVRDAVLTSLKNNPNVALQKAASAIRKTYESEARAEFDPVLAGSVSKSKTETLQLSGSATGTVDTVADRTTGSVSLSTTLPTGTKLGVSASADISGTSANESDLAGARFGVSVSQSLLRGLGTGANLAALRQARLDSRISEYEFRGYIQSLVAQVERQYWDNVLAARNLAIYRESVSIAEKQLQDTQERITVGKLATVELAAAQAELALRREGLINAEGLLETSRIKLLQYLGICGAGAWKCTLKPKDEPVVGEVGADAPEEHVAVGDKLRPDLAQARLAVERNELEVVRTRNGYLPKLDVFASFGQTGYAESLGKSVGADEGKGYDRTVGITAEWPLFNRKPAAQKERAMLSKESSGNALKNMKQLVEVDIRSAIVEVNRTKEQIKATQATRTFQFAKLQAETEKFNAGKSTSLLVAQAQRDYLQSQVGEINALISYNKALTDLFLKDGSLLQRRGLDVP
ncbi:MAG: hypothetical protein C0404_08335 [Verrucomicrobia bacterium]|nr:hypothetical protein [Verrucomicrobiota bacterium]